MTIQLNYRQLLVDCLDVFAANYQCPDCAQKSAFYLENCLNPLHELHDHKYFLESQENGV
jgi:hypothetical protein